MGWPLQKAEWGNLITTCLYFYCSKSFRFCYENLIVLLTLGILVNRFTSQSLEYSMILNNESQTKLQLTVLESVSNKAQQRIPILKGCNESSKAELLPRGTLNSEQLWQMSTYGFFFQIRSVSFSFFFFPLKQYKKKCASKNCILTA